MVSSLNIDLGSEDSLTELCRLVKTKGLEHSLEQIKLETPKEDIQNPKDYIILEGKQYRGYSYPDLLVRNKRSFERNNWDQTHIKLSEDNSLMLTLRQYVDFLRLLRSGKAFNGEGSKISTARLFKDITKSRNHWEAEWLDAKFFKQGDNLQIEYHKIEQDSSLQKASQPLVNYLEQDIIPGISLNCWLNSATTQGLPSRRTTDGSLYYWHPRNEGVAVIHGRYRGLILNLNGDPSRVSDSFGVRCAKIFIR